jgi:hypothetical protein
MASATSSTTSSSSSTSSSTASISNLVMNIGPTDYYTNAFRQVLEDHMAYLRGLTSTKAMPVQEQQAWANEGDLYGYLANVLNIQPQYHWVIMRLNNFTCRTQFGQRVRRLLIPDFTLLEQIRSAWNTSSTISN